VRGRTAGALSLVAAMLLLQGCVAAVIPAIAASSIVRSRGKIKRHAVTGRGIVTPTAQAAMGTVGTLTTLKALPPPTGATTGDPTMQFVNHALMVAATGKLPAHSMVLSPQSTLEKVEFIPCDSGQPLAVAIDAGLASATRLTEALRRLRAFSVEVLWIADPAEVDPLRAELKRSGAWTNGDAPILVTGAGAERKELVRREATRAFCVVAVAGAKRSDVDELYSFLRDPIFAGALESYWNAGWFVLPADGMGKAQ